MTRFIIFRDVVLNADEIQYVLIEPANKRIRKESGWSEADWAVTVVVGKDSSVVSFAYASKDHAKRGVAQIYNLLNPPAMITDGGVIINVPEGTDPNAFPLTSTPSTTIGQP